MFRSIHNPKQITIVFETYKSMYQQKHLYRIMTYLYLPIEE